MDITLEYTLERYADDSIDLVIEGEFDPGDSESRWGYYGADPGYGASASITAVLETVVVYGPKENPYTRMARGYLDRGEVPPSWLRSEAHWVPTAWPMTKNVPWEDISLTPEPASTCVVTV